jgi:hypothetical protein
VYSYSVFQVVFEIMLYLYVHVYVHVISKTTTIGTKWYQWY